MKMNRRQFLTTSIAGAGALMISLPQAALAAEAAPGAVALTEDPFQIVPLGKTGLKVSLIGMGTGVKASNRKCALTKMEKANAEALLRHAYEQGVRYFDCADWYGTHMVMQEPLKSFIPRDKVVICSKKWMGGGKIMDPNGPEDAATAIDRFRKELGTDYIDFVQIHCMMSPGWIEASKKLMDDMEALKQKGVIKAHGASFHKLDSIKACVGNNWVQTMHVRLNAYGTAMDAPPEQVGPVVQQLAKEGKGIIAMKVLGEGKLASDPAKIDASIRYILGLNAVSTMIVGFTEAKQIDDFASRVRLALKEKPVAKKA